jgi:hypothetical protein
MDSIEVMNIDSRLHSLPHAIFKKSEFLDEFEFYRTSDKAPGFPHVFFWYGSSAADKHEEIAW